MFHLLGLALLLSFLYGPQGLGHPSSPRVLQLKGLEFPASVDGMNNSGCVGEVATQMTDDREGSFLLRIQAGSEKGHLQLPEAFCLGEDDLGHFTNSPEDSHMANSVPWQIGDVMWREPLGATRPIPFTPFMLGLTDLQSLWT